MRSEDYCDRMVRPADKLARGREPSTQPPTKKAAKKIKRSAPLDPDKAIEKLQDK
jgi:hypothetical protein